ncbi:ARM repeat-containing protein [Sistotremastrum niveocremeum HHB9708]|uniref:ARM repeat-containing protein n=1 Tax=Sistotremastrum niveocremeum HHB9708 TaxID=1314777 RepID=A0A164ZW17_9AGAM|nr:ARM repeat-containing protein [Sistotremastrum niveocremeum HHB9708]
MEGQNTASIKAKEIEEASKAEKRLLLRNLNAQPVEDNLKALDSSLKRHTTLFKKMKLSIGADNRDQILKDLDTLSLEKYIDELAGATVEGAARCKTEKDIWSAVEIISTVHRRFPTSYTPSVINLLAAQLAAPSRAAAAQIPLDLKEKEDAARVSRQRPILRLCSELALVGIIKDGSNRSGGEWIMKTLKDLLSNDPSLSSLPLLTSFLKSYSKPFLGISPFAAPLTATAHEDESNKRDWPTLENGAAEDQELVEKEIRDRFKRMCEGYFESVSKKLVIEHNRLQEQDRRNHEAYIRSGEIFEDRQQAYEKMTKNYEKILTSCQSLSELIRLPMPHLPTASQNQASIGLSTNDGGRGDVLDEINTSTGSGKWEDEEERKFYEDLMDLADFVPKTVLGLEEDVPHDKEQEEQDLKAKEEEVMSNLEKEIAGLGIGGIANGNGDTGLAAAAEEDQDGEDDVPTPVPSRPSSPSHSPTVVPSGPSQLLTALLIRLPDATNRSLIDQAALDFAFLNSKAARKRLVKFLFQAPKNRIDILPYYARMVATLNKYMPDVGRDLVSMLEEEARYLNKKRSVRELTENRLRNISYFCALTKFKVVPSHVILHLFKLCLDDFKNSNVESMALLLEGCGRFLLRSDDTRERMTKMLELMRRKQSLQHFDQRQMLLLENAYYQCNPPDRAPRMEKHRSNTELFIFHVIYDVLSKKTIDKVLRLIRKLHWDDPEVVQILHKVFIKPWKLKYSSIGLLAMLTYDLQRYHPSFSVGVVDRVIEDIRRELEYNNYSRNQRRVASMKFLGELYIYRLISSTVIFDTLWMLVTFGHPDGRPLPNQITPLDMPDDFFRVRLTCVLLDTCAMCFDRGSQKKKLDSFLTFFQLYVLCKEPTPMDVEFMLTDSLEALRPKTVFYKTFEEAAAAVDEMISSALGTVEDPEGDGGDSDEESAVGQGVQEADDDEDGVISEPQNELDRPASPSDDVVVLSTAENLGPSEEADAEFAKELAKMVIDNSGESRRVDRKTAQALWDSAVIPAGLKKKRTDEDGPDDQQSADKNVMNFTVLSKRGNKQLTHQLFVPASSALAAETRSAQLQDKVEQQHLKRLVLDYEQREEEAAAMASRVANWPKLRPGS